MYNPKKPPSFQSQNGLQQGLAPWMSQFYYFWLTFQIFPYNLQESRQGESDPKGEGAFPHSRDAPVRVARASVRPLAGFPRYSPTLWGNVSRATARGYRTVGIRLAAEPESVSSKRGNTNRKGEGTAYFPESKLPAKGSFWNRRRFLFPRDRTEGKRKAETLIPAFLGW